MKQSIVGVDIQYEYGGKCVLDELKLDDHVRRIETSTGKETFAVILYYKDDTMTSFEFKNKFIVVIRIAYGAGFTDWAPTLEPIEVKA